MALSGWIHERAERDPAFRTRVAGERLVVDLSIALADAMKARGITREELASHLNVPAADVTKLLRGDSTVTVAAAAQVAQSLGYRARLVFEPDPAIGVTPWRTIRDRKLTPEKRAGVDAQVARDLRRMDQPNEKVKTTPQPVRGRGR